MAQNPAVILGVIFGLCAGSVMAQDESSSTTETEPETTAETTTTDELEGAAPDTQADTSVEPALSDEKVVAVHGDWQIRCRGETADCSMYQLAIDSREVPISEVYVVPLQADDGRVAGFTILTPLRTLLTEGVLLQIDGGSEQRYQFGWCTEAGCVARFAVREDGLNQFKRGNKAQLTVRSVEKPDPPVILDVSLTGFTAAFEDLLSRN